MGQRSSLARLHPSYSLGFALVLGLVACVTTPRVQARPPLVNCSPSTPVSATTQPNFILIVTDDQDAASSAYMPELQKQIGCEGVTFNNAFVTTSLCCPSRASILRGQYAHNHQVFSNKGQNGGFSQVYKLGLEQSTIATWLHDAGYTTMFAGKYFNGYSNKMPDYIPPGWDEWMGWLNGPYYNYQVNDNGGVVTYGKDPDDYSTDVIRDYALGFLENTGENQPFFMYLAPLAPHWDDQTTPLSAVAPSRHEDDYQDLQLPYKPSLNETSMSDKPSWLRGIPKQDLTTLDEVYQKRLRSLLAVDDLITALIQTLERTGQLENTYIIFTSDNGYHLGEHRLSQGKQLAYEEDIRVPLLIRGPGIPTGVKREELALNIDLPVTIADLAGVEVPSFVDGRSLAPLLMNESTVWRKNFLIESWRPTDATDVNQLVSNYQGIRTATHKYVQWTYPEEALEVYDLRQDPYELSNLQGQGLPNEQAWASHLEALSKCIAEVCRTLENKDLNSLE
jgi:N-acetylglucosamine-6-sulfatase